MPPAARALTANLRRAGGSRERPGSPAVPDTVAGGLPFGVAFWVLLAVLLGVNWIVSSHFNEPPPRPTVSYTFFIEQVKASQRLGD